MARKKILSTLALFSGLYFVPAAASANCPDDLENDNFETSVIECIKSLKNQIRQLGGNPDSENTEPATELVLARIPSGLVASFDLPDGCPRGWSTFKEGTARFIIGAGTEFDPKYRKWRQRRQGGGVELVDLVSRPLRSDDGEEAHILSEEEMPRHGHAYTDNYFHIDRPAPPNSFGGHLHPMGGRQGSMGPTTAEKGGNGQHNNMPPYIALYFCKKD